MKTCDVCGSTSNERLSVCPECEEILEESPYFWIIWISVGIGGVCSLVFKRMGFEGRGMVIESIYTATAIIVIATPAWKIAMWLRCGKRNPLRELASLYSDRMGRVMILFVLIAMPLIEFNVIPPFSGAAGNVPKAWSVSRTAVILFGFAIYLPTIFFFFRLNLFDLTKKNALVEYERGLDPDEPGA